MEKISYKFEVFEGPLDLLLHLISKNKLNIYDISISVLLEQFLAHIEEIKQADLEVTSEFLEMAARLVYIKSVSLLPVHEKADDLKKELASQLIDYQLCKLAAEQLSQNVTGFNFFTRQQEKFPIDQTYLLQHDPKTLLSAYFSARGRGTRKLPPPISSFSGIVQRKIVSVNSRVFYVLRNLRTFGKVTFSDLFLKSESKSEMVATFLAVLELIKSKRINTKIKNQEIIISLSNGEK